MVVKLCRSLKDNCTNQSRRWIFLNAGVRGLSRSYVPNEVEPEVASLWSTRPLVPSPRSGPHVTRLSMVLPPPNVTGTLHLGHALTTTLQDVLAKRWCMRGEEVVWVPGLDHAGIATQAVVELVLSASGVDTSSMQRDTLLHHIDDWKQSKAAVIGQQLRSLAPSLHWNREFFTLDQGQSEAVSEAFVRLYKAGLVYRAERLVNWSVKLGSALSDMEVDFVRVSGPTTLSPPSSQTPVVFGQMTDVAFKLHANPDEELVVSTCRLETMPGDTAVAVHPGDSRYSRYHGSLLVHPLTGELIPLVLEPSVDPDFGTGVVKVTPGHDQADFETATRHGLKLVSVIDETGHLCSSAGPYAGLERFQAREVICRVLREKGLIRRVRDHNMSVPVCSRTGDVIELISKPQWFLKCSEMGRRALEAVEKGHLEIVPDLHVKHWTSYLENIRDWCISRQVVWGHRLPLLTDGDGKFMLSAGCPQEEWESRGLHQVEDVLDTWFSSALLPFSVFGWPHSTDDMKKYFPLDVMVTGHDILFFWVARMVMLSLQLTNQLPFKRVLLHGVICDPQGRKMSKSLGNVVDPQHIIHGISHQEMVDEVEERVRSGALRKEEAELARANVSRLYPEGIPQCGTDALRLSLLSHRAKNHYIDFEIEACYTNKLFCNKLWQACRFTEDWVSRLLPTHSLDRPPVASSKLDVWLLRRLLATVHSVDQSLDTFDFHIAVTAVKDFVHHTFCDVYLEGVKGLLRSTEKEERRGVAGVDEGRECCYILLYSLVQVVKLLAPMAPYVSEKLYQHLQPHLRHVSVHHSHWPTTHTLSMSLPPDADKIDEEVSTCLSIVKEIRRLKLTLKETNSQESSVGVLSSRGEFSSDLVDMMKNLSRCDVEMLTEKELEGWSLFSTLGQDLSILSRSPYARPRQQPSSQEERSTGDTKRLEKMEKELEKIMKMRSHDSYRSKVAESVQRAHSDKILRLQTEIQQLKNQT